MKKTYFVFTFLLLIAMTHTYAFEPCFSCNCEICECVDLQQQLQNVEQQLKQITKKIQKLEDEGLLEPEANEQRRHLMENRQSLELIRLGLKLIQGRVE